MAIHDLNMASRYADKVVMLNGGGFSMPANQHRSSPKRI